MVFPMIETTSIFGHLDTGIIVRQIPDTVPVNAPGRSLSSLKEAFRLFGEPTRFARITLAGGKSGFRYPDRQSLRAETDLIEFLFPSEPVFRPIPPIVLSVPHSGKAMNPHHIDVLKDSPVSQDLKPTFIDRHHSAQDGLLTEMLRPISGCGDHF